MSRYVIEWVGRTRVQMHCPAVLTHPVGTLDEEVQVATITSQDVHSVGMMDSGSQTLTAFDWMINNLENVERQKARSPNPDSSRAREVKIPIVYSCSVCRGTRANNSSAYFML